MTRRNFIKWLIVAVWTFILSISIFLIFRRSREDVKGSLTESVKEHTEHPIEAGTRLLLSFFIISDLHITSSSSSPSDHLRKALDDIKMFEDKAQAIFVTGDITDAATTDDYKEYQNIMSQYQLPPVYANMGNHDYYNVWIDKNGAWIRIHFRTEKPMLWRVRRSQLYSNWISPIMTFG